MKIEHFIMIRFSIKKKDGKGFHHPVVNWDKKRLRNRFLIFENSCFPSLAAQTNKDNFHVIIMISHDLPNEFKSRLHNYLEPHKFAHVVEVDNLNWGSGDFLKEFCSDDSEYIITTRLDDDDALHPQFSQIIKDFVLRKNLLTI